MHMTLSKLQEDSEGQGSLACCSPSGHKESDMPEQLNNDKKRKIDVEQRISERMPMQEDKV